MSDSMKWISPMTALLLAMAPAAFAAETLASGTFSHDEWTTVLQKYVDTQGLVDYESLAKDRAVLDSYLAKIHTISPRSHPDLFPTRNAQLAYYINAYNALVFEGVLSRGPEKKSVWRGLISGLNFFVLMKVDVGGESVSLKHLEDEWIRAGFEDPRIHAALNCASISCPRLPQVAFSAENLDAELDAAMREFVADPRNFKIDDAKETVYLSEIFDFFPKDFLDYEKKNGNSDPNLIDYANRYRDAGAKAPRDFRIKFFKYDKGINSQP